MALDAHGTALSPAGPEDDVALGFFPQKNDWPYAWLHDKNCAHKKVWTLESAKYDQRHQPSQRRSRKVQEGLPRSQVRHLQGPVLPE
eukprot:1390136-Amphidinium_carterae.2